MFRYPEFWFGAWSSVSSHLHKALIHQFWCLYLQARAGNPHFLWRVCSQPVRVLRTLGRGGWGQHRESWVRKGFLHPREGDTDLAGWEIRASSSLTADLISTALPGDERAQHFIGCFNSSFLNTSSCARLRSPLPSQVQGRSIPEIFRIKRGLIFFSIASPGFQTRGERKEGRRVSTTISRRGKDAWHWESSVWDSLISPRALSVLEDHCFWHVSPAAEWEDLLGWNLGPRGTWKSYS